MESIDKCYARLGLKNTASESEIRSAYRTIAKRLHPDLNPDLGTESHLELSLVDEAYENLMRIKKKESKEHYQPEKAPPQQKTKKSHVFYNLFSKGGAYYAEYKIICPNENKYTLIF